MKGHNDMPNLHLHIRHLVPQNEFNLNGFVIPGRNIYSTMGITLRLDSVSFLPVPADLLDIDVGFCSENPSLEIGKLSDYRVNIPFNHVAVFICRSLHYGLTPEEGCASHFPNKPMVVISKTARPITLAHELGHVLGIRGHGNGGNYLMSIVSTITSLNPVLRDSDQRTIRRSTLLLEN